MPLSIDSPWLLLSLGAGLAGVVTFLLTPTASRLADWIGAVDLPDPRKSHLAPTPRLGGAAMALGVSLAIFVSILLSGVERLSGLAQVDVVVSLLAVLLVFLLGAADDIRGLSALRKLLIQSFAAGLVLLGGGAIQAVNLPFWGEVYLGPFGYLVSFLWLVGVTNAFNLIDGLDGLAVGAGLIICASVTMIALLKGEAVTALVAATMTGACAGFLPRNQAPASVFMGDCGSLTMGFVLAVLTHHSSLKAATTAAFLVPLLALGLPVIDTLLVMVFRFASGPERRLVRRVARMFVADRAHVHHLVSHLAATRSTVVAVLYSLVALFCLAALTVTLTNDASLGFALLLVGFFVVGLLRLAGSRARTKMERGDAHEAPPSELARTMGTRLGGGH